MSESSPRSRKTAVYIDGYNLYYGRLRGTAFKWLDAVKLFENLLAQRNQNESLERVNLFTAYALASFATNGEASVHAQSAYLRALQTLYGDRIGIIYGKHSFDRNGTQLPTFTDGEPYDRSKRTRVWKLEEKKTDVNLAIGMYRDASQGRYDRIILVSNDSDAEPALEAIRADFPKIMIGVVMPIHPPEGNNTHRRASGSLTKVADWVVHHLSDEQLLQAQLPPVVQPIKKKAIKKPAHWSPREP